MPQSHQTNRHATDKISKIILICRYPLVNFFPAVTIGPHERCIERMKRTLTVQVIDIYRTLVRHHRIISDHHLRMMVRGTDLIANGCGLHHEYIWYICFETVVRW